MDEIDVAAIQRKAAELPACTKDIDADVAAAIREAWSAEGIDLKRRRVSKRKGRAARDRFLRSYPELVRALASRYEQVMPGKLSDAGYIGLWMYCHSDDWRDYQESRPDRVSGDIP